MIRKQQGFTLLEILISLSLGVFLLWGILQIFDGNSKTARFSDSMAEIQERGRFAIEQLTSAIRLTGHQGCANPYGSVNGSIEAVVLSNNTAGAAVQPNTGGSFNATAIRGWEYSGSWNPALPNPGDINGYGISPRANTDVIAIQYGQPGLSAASFTSGTPDVITVAAGSAIAESFPLADGDATNGKQYGIISDCAKADFVEVENFDTGTLSVNTTHITETYAPTATFTLLMPFRSAVFYIADSPAKNSSGSFIPSLYVTEYDGTTTGTTSELISGVENMQISYGERLASGAIRFVPANTPPVMGNVVMVKIGLLMVGDSPVLTNDDTSSFSMPGGVTLTNGGGYANDRHLRRAFVTTIKLRNRN